MPIHIFCNQCEDFSDLNSVKRIDSLHVISILSCGHFITDHEPDESFTEDGINIRKELMEEE